MLELLILCLELVNGSPASGDAAASQLWHAHVPSPQLACDATPLQRQCVKSQTYFCFSSTDLCPSVSPNIPVAFIEPDDVARFSAGILAWLLKLPSYV